MELFLWLYLYDNRWLFEFKIPIKTYKNLWMIPIFAHIILLLTAVYYFQVSDNFECTESLRVWLYNRMCFSFIIVLNMITFVIKLMQTYDKHTAKMKKISKVYPIISRQIHEFNYPIRISTLISTPGVMLFILSSVSFFWSSNILTNYSTNYYDSCNSNIQKVLDYHSYAIYYCNLFVFVLFGITCTIKITCLLISSFFIKVYLAMANNLKEKRRGVVIHFRDEGLVKS